MVFPRLIPVRQHFPDRRIPDIRDAVQRQLAVSGFSSRLQPQARVALGVTTVAGGARTESRFSTIRCRSRVRDWRIPGSPEA